VLLDAAGRHEDERLTGELLDDLWLREIDKFLDAKSIAHRTRTLGKP
jgi:hypothetical protein